MFFGILRQQIYEWSFYINQNLMSSFREIVHCYVIKLLKIVNSENNNTRALLVSIRQCTLFGHPSLLGGWCPISKFEEAKRFVRKTHCILLLWISKLTCKCLRKRGNGGPNNVHCRTFTSNTLFLQFSVKSILLQLCVYNIVFSYSKTRKTHSLENINGKHIQFDGKLFTKTMK